MPSTRKKRQSNRRFLSQLDDFDQDIIIGNSASEGQENSMISEGTNDRDLTVGTSTDSFVAIEIKVFVKTFERSFNDGIDKEMSIIVDTVEKRIQNAILTAIDSIVATSVIRYDQCYSKFRSWGRYNDYCLY